MTCFLQSVQRVDFCCTLVSFKQTYDFACCLHSVRYRSENIILYGNESNILHRCITYHHLSNGTGMYLPRFGIESWLVVNLEIVRIISGHCSTIISRYQSLDHFLTSISQYVPLLHNHVQLVSTTMFLPLSTLINHHWPSLLIIKTNHYQLLLAIVGHKWPLLATIYYKLLSTTNCYNSMSTIVCNSANRHPCYWSPVNYRPWFTIRQSVDISQQPSWLETMVDCIIMVEHSQF